MNSMEWKHRLTRIKYISLTVTAYVTTFFPASSWCNLSVQLFLGKKKKMEKEGTDGKQNYYPEVQEKVCPFIELLYLNLDQKGHGKFKSIKG